MILPVSFRPQRGFTMVELIVVMVLVGILGAIGASRFFDRAGFDLPAYAEQLRTMLRFAQKSAIARNAPVFVRFEENRISLCLAEPSGGCPPAAQVASPGGIGLGDEASETQCGKGNWYCVGTPVGVAWTTAPVLDWLRFDALGRPSQPGGVLGGLTLTITGGRSESQTVRVTEETGYVR